MEQLYDKPITDATDWGGDASTGGLMVKKNRVQEYIKTRFAALDSRASSIEETTAKSLTDLNERLELSKPFDLSPWFFNDSTDPIPIRESYCVKGENGVIVPVHCVTNSPLFQGIVFCAGIHGESHDDGTENATVLDSMLLFVHKDTDSTFSVDYLSSASKLPQELEVLEDYVHPLSVHYQRIIRQLTSRVEALERIVAQQQE